MPTMGPVLDLQRLSYPELTTARLHVLKALIEVSGSDDAAKILKVGKRIMPEVRAQRELLHMPCAPAWKVYTGVLYQAAQLDKHDDVMIFSGLFGLTTAQDLIPAYRLSMATSLPGIGSLKTFWRHALAQAGLNQTDSRQQHRNDLSNHTQDDAETVIDLRSGAYQVTTTSGPCWDLRVVDAHGRVVTHAAKHYRGLLTRALLDANRAIQEHASTHTSIGTCASGIDVEQVARTLGEIEITHHGSHHHITLKPNHV